MTNGYYAVVHFSDHIEHTGVKGMRWGVRKSKYGRSFERGFKKAARKLSKLQDISSNSKKYAKRAAAYGAGAIGTGLLAARFATLDPKRYTTINSTTKKPYYKIQKSPNSIVGTIRNAVVPKHSISGKMSNLPDAMNKIIPSKSQSKVPRYIGIGVGAAASAGLGIAAAKNAYRAANADRYRKKASNLKKAMDKKYKGTKYQGVYTYKSKSKRK